MMQIFRPEPVLKSRPINEAVRRALCDQGIEPFLARIIATRVDAPDKALALIKLRLGALTDPFKMKGMEKAVSRVIEAIQKGEIIGLETDHDCDGQTSHAVLFEALTKIFQHPKAKVLSYIGHRMEEGYGLSDALAKRILNSPVKPTLVITADNGSSDEVRIAVLKTHGIDTIVTDHHAIPEEGVPKSACAVLNPTQSDCCFNDPFIAGCMVAWLLVAGVRKKMKALDILPDSAYQITELLDFVAVGTIADCVSMARSVNNRIAAYYGMIKISQKKRACWQAFSDYFHHKVDSELLGFLIAPLLNSDGRMADALSSVNFLLSEKVDETLRWIDFLHSQNQKRKAVQKAMTAVAMTGAFAQYRRGKNSICIYLDNGHAGVHGISASRLKDAFGRPVILFSPKLGEDNVISGSARSVDGINIKAVLDTIAGDSEGIFIKYGGHSGAAGMTILKSQFENFTVLFEKTVSELVEQKSLSLMPVIYTEGALKSEELSLTTVDKIAELEPFGREFEAPIFCNSASIISLKWVGKDRAHLQLHLQIENKCLKAIWFFAAEFSHSDNCNKVRPTFK